MATRVQKDFRKIAFPIQKSLKARLRDRLKTRGQLDNKKIKYTIPKHIQEVYGRIKQIRFVGNDKVLVPIGYVSHKKPLAKAKVINKYTAEGRASIHKGLERIDKNILHYLMRNPVILYATKSGATGECASMLAKKLKNCPTYNLKQTTPDITAIDMIIIGTGVRMGKIYKPVLNFIRQNLDLLITKTVAIYFCNAYPDTFQKAIDKNIPIELINHSVCIKSFGGKPAFTNPPKGTWINMKNIDDFIGLITNQIDL